MLTASDFIVFYRILSRQDILEQEYSVNRTRLGEKLESRHKIHLDRLNHGHCVNEKRHIQIRETQTQNHRQLQRLKTRPKTRQDLEKGCEVESINISGRHLHLHHHLHRVSRIKRHQMSKGHDASTEDEIIRHENSDTTTPRVYKESLRRPVKKTSTAPTLFATKSPVRATRVLPDEYLGERRPFSQYRAPTSGAKPCSSPLLEKASCCAIPGEYSEQMYNGMDSRICSVYSVFVL